METYHSHAAETVDSALPQPPEAPRKKRRWWFWVLISLGCLLLLGLGAFLALAGYYHSLIDNYTQTQPLEFVQMDVSKAKQEEAKKRLLEFFFALRKGDRAEPLRLSAEDLNLLVSDNRELKDIVRFQIEDGEFRARFSVPLEKSKKKELKGRHLNGVATLDLQHDFGTLTLHVKEIYANEKPIPGWLLSKAKQQNLLEFMEGNIELTEFLMKLDSVELTDGHIVLAPFHQM